MNAKELISGSYVFFKVGDQKNVVKIDGRWLHDIELKLVDFEPIPITKELLTKNGFTGDNYNMGVLGIESKHTDEEGTEWTDWSVCVWEGMFVQAKKGVTIAKKRCKYVHELQLLLSFVGIEKEIEI